jgi:hypothetical protein
MSSFDQVRNVEDRPSLESGLNHSLRLELGSVDTMSGEIDALYIYDEQKWVVSCLHAPSLSNSPVI